MRWFRRLFHWPARVLYSGRHICAYCGREGTGLTLLDAVSGDYSCGCHLSEQA